MSMDHEAWGVATSARHFTGSFAVRYTDGDRVFWRTDQGEELSTYQLVEQGYTPDRPKAVNQDKMSGTFVDLEDTIAEDEKIDEWPQTQVLRDTLEWLDKHPDQVPGRTMTVGEMDHKCTTYGSAYETGFKQAGGVIVPDPEPTNAEQINEAYDVWDREPQNFTFGEYLDRLGWVKAPGGDE